MKYQNRDEFERANVFGTGASAAYSSDQGTGNSYRQPLDTPGCPVALVNESFEPGARSHWHAILSEKGGQLLLCTAGEGWYQEEGERPTPMVVGSVVWVPPGVRHWFGAMADSWFSQVVIDSSPANARVQWGAPVAEEAYGGLPSRAASASELGDGKYATRARFQAANPFGTGMWNFMLRRYFTGSSYLKMLLWPWTAPMLPMNVSFEPSCRNNWHVHHATRGGGQLLICTAGEGWYQVEGADAVPLRPGSVVYIPAEAKHWHGAAADTWFSHIALDIPGEGKSNEWFEVVDDAAYAALGA